MVQEPRFQHRISKGSKFNQIYIPTEMNSQFGIGDIVEIRLIKKKEEIFSSKNLPELGEFKEKLIKQIFTTLSNLKEIEQIFLVGSFLTKKADYQDIDLLIISDEKEIELDVEKYLNENIPLKFHIFSMTREKLNELLEICPVTRSMLNYFISNKEFEGPINTRIDKDHINFLMMMPEDILTIELNSRKFYDAIRRLITIEKFLDSKQLDQVKIEEEIKKLLGEKLFEDLKKNNNINEKEIVHLRNIIKDKLKKIKSRLSKNE